MFLDKNVSSLPEKWTEWFGGNWSNVATIKIFETEIEYIHEKQGKYTK